MVRVVEASKPSNSIKKFFLFTKKLKTIATRALETPKLLKMF
jgi:hypothetical protein